MKLINDIIEFGAHQASDSDAIKRIILANKIALVFLVASFPFMAAIFYAKLYMLSFAVPINMILFVLTLFLNKQGQFLYAKFVLYFSILISIYFYAGMLGEYSGIQYVYLSIMGFGFGIFDSKHRSLQYWTSILPIAGFLLLYFTDFAFFYTIVLTQRELSPIYITSILLIFAIIWLTIIFFDQSNTFYKKSLKDVLLTYQLSEREGEVFLHILNGQSNKSISDQLFIEEGTVKNHLTNIYRKLNVKSRNELMAKFTG